MAATEHARHQLYQRLTETIGSNEAKTLMELLPPSGEPEPASKADIERLAERMDQRFLGVDARFVSIDERSVSIDERFEQVDQRFDQMNQRLTEVDQRFDQMNQRFEQVDQRFDQMNQRLTEVDRNTELRIETCEHGLRGEMHGLRSGTEVAFSDMRIELRTGLADLRTELHRSLRINLLVTVGFLGTLISLLALITVPT